jgi:hypothetical protein
MDRRVFVAASAGFIAGNVQNALGQQPSWRSRLLGAWSLTEAVTVVGDDVSPWLGRQTPITGVLMYLDNGWMSAQIGGDRRGGISQVDYEKLSADERLKSLNQYYAYYGKFEIDEAARVITHRVADSLFLYEKATVYRRRFELDGETLTLLTEPRDQGGKTRFNRLIWKKIA